MSQPSAADTPMGDMLDITSISGEGFMQKYMAKNGDMYDFDTSPAACSHFGFYSSSRVETPRGQATVIGVYDNYLWFHVDGDRGASYWDNARTYEDMLRIGVAIVQVQPDEVYGEYRLKRIELPSGAPVNIVLQNANGPCPLIAISNVLAIRRCIKIESSQDRVTVNSLVTRITDYIKTIHPNPSPEQQEEIDQLIKEMPQLQYGLDVNFTFTSCCSFESSKKMKIFDLLNIRMVHGWLVDPQSPAATVIGNFTYNDLTLQLVTLRDTIEQKNKPVEKKDEKMEEAKDGEKKEEEKKEEKKEERVLTDEEGIILEDFLNSTSHQLTPYGLASLHETLKDDELVVFFRNNHFSTLTKHNGKLYNLVTDIGYERERNVIWDLLSSVDGNSLFYSGLFQSTDDVKNDEIVNTALEFGFAKEKIDEAIVAVRKPNEELKIDDVLAWLSTNAPPA